MIDRVPTGFTRWVAIEALGLFMVGVLILMYGRMAPGAENTRAAAPAGWVAAPTATPDPSQAARVPAIQPTAEPVAQPPAPTAIPKPAGPAKHTVQGGETLSQIAQRYGVTQDALVAANNLPDRNSVIMGQELLIPEPVSQPTPASGAPAGGAQSTPAQQPAGPAKYKVVGGDTLNTIAQKFGVSLEAIIQANNLSNADDISIDQELVIPSR